MNRRLQGREAPPEAVELEIEEARARPANAHSFRYPIIVPAEDVGGRIGMKHRARRRLGEEWD